MAWYSRFFNRRDDAADKAEPSGADADFEDAEWWSGEDDDAYAPARRRAKILARVKLDAEADAIRHAEDMLDRDFPIVNLSRSIAEGRLAALETSFLSKRTVIDQRMEELTSAIAALQRSVRDHEGALRRRGIPDGDVTIDPLLGEPSIEARAGAGAGCIAAVALTVDAFSLSGPLAILGSALVLVAVALIIWKLPAPSLEDPEITRLRKARKRDQGQLEVYRGELEAARKDLKGLEEATVSLAKSEAVFPADLVGTYQRAAFSALPAGTLEQGRSLRSQEPPHIEFPAWVRRLAGFEE